jgi:hypothetical protein
MAFTSKLTLYFADGSNDQIARVAAYPASPIRVVPTPLFQSVPFLPIRCLRGLFDTSRSDPLLPFVSNAVLSGDRPANAQQSSPGHCCQ